MNEAQKQEAILWLQIQLQDLPGGSYFVTPKSVFFKPYPGASWEVWSSGGYGDFVTSLHIAKTYSQKVWWVY